MHPKDVPTPTARKLVLAAAALVAVAAAVAVLVHGSRSGAPPAASHPGLTGDVDGDGRPDRVWLGRGDVLVVELGSGGAVRQLLEDGPHLEALVDVGASGQGIATSSGPHGRDWEVWGLRGRRLVRLHTRGLLEAQRGSGLVWAAGHGLYTGMLDPLQDGRRRVALVARRWTLSQGRLSSHADGLRCWVRGAAPAPTTCGPHRHWAYDAGPHGRLPSLLPEAARPRSTTRAHVVSGADTWSLRPTSRVRLGVRRFALLDRHHAHVLRRLVPLNFSPVMFRRPVHLGRAAHGVLLSQEGGDLDSWHVYARWDGRIRQLPTRGPVRLGGGFLETGDTAYLSWTTPAGRLFTRVGTPRPGHFRVYAWRAGLGPAGPYLHAVSLGTVCIDDLLGTYGTCRPGA